MRPAPQLPRARRPGRTLAHAALLLRAARLTAPTQDPGWFTAALASEPEEGAVDVDGCPIHYLRWGTRGHPVLVLVHGAAAHAQWWSFVAPLLADGWCVVAPDLSGHGDSGWRDGYRLEQWAEEVLAVAEASAPSGHGPRARQSGRPNHPGEFDHASSGGPPVPGVPVVLGHSLGGRVVAAAAALATERVGAAILCDTGVGSRRRPLRDVRHFADVFVYPTRDEAVARFALVPRQPCANPFVLRHVAETSVTRRGTGWSWKFDWALFAHASERSPREYLTRVPGPVAFVHGQESAVATAASVRRAREAYGRPAPVVPLVAAHHHVWLDQPLAFVAVVRALLAAWAAVPAVG